MYRHVWSTPPVLYFLIFIYDHFSVILYAIISNAVDIVVKQTNYQLINQSINILRSQFINHLISHTLLYDASSWYSTVKHRIRRRHCRPETYTTAILFDEILVPFVKRFFSSGCLKSDTTRGHVGKDSESKNISVSGSPLVIPAPLSSLPFRRLLTIGRTLARELIFTTPDYCSCCWNAWNYYSLLLIVAVNFLFVRINLGVKRSNKTLPFNICILELISIKFMSL